jgi:hypothetical protein
VALGELLEEHGDLIDPLIGCRRERFIESVLGTLDYAIRRDENLMPAALQGADLYWLTEKLRFLLKACFMHESGMPKDVIHACFSRNALFQQLRDEELSPKLRRTSADEAPAAPLLSQQPVELALLPTGSPELVRFSNYMRSESPHRRAVAMAAYFDEALGRLLGSRDESLKWKITKAYRNGLLTNNERDDLDEIRRLRNIAAHHAGGQEFDEEQREVVQSLKTWQIAVEAMPQYGDMIPKAEDRLLYVAAIIAARLGHRSVSRGGQPLAEPDVTDITSWPPLTGS